jgi:hypothetical protein
MCGNLSAIKLDFAIAGPCHSVAPEFLRNVVMGLARLRVLLVLVLLSLSLWIVFAALVVPPVIESVYRGDSWSFLNGLIRGQAVHSVGHYIQLWNKITIVGVTSILGLWLLTLLFSTRTFIKHFVGEATPGVLGAIRMWTCSILLLTTLLEDFGSIAWLPPEVRDPKGLLTYLYPLGLEALVTSENSLRVFQVATELLLFLGVIGWRTRVVLPFAAICHFVLLGVLIDYSFFWHQNLVPLYVLMVLCFTPCGDAWSVDRMRKIAQGQTVPDSDRGSAVYGWARYACWVTISLPYVATGLSKLEDGGFLWWNATNMRAMLYADTLNPREFDWALSLRLVYVPDVFLALMGLFALCGETLFGLVLFSGLARRILPAAAIMIHTGIFAFQRILFIDLILLQLVFYDWTRLGKTVGGWLGSRRGRLHILYDRVSRLGALVYGHVARGRLRWHRCDVLCPTQLPETGRAAARTTTGDVIGAFGPPVAVSGMILVALLCWFYRIEFYPFTSWHLYSGSNTTGTVEYRKVFAQHESGGRSRARLEDTIGAIALDNRYSPFLAKCFRDRSADVAICHQFLTAAAAAYNKKMQPGRRVMQYEIEVWKWDFRSSPYDPNYGSLTRRFVFEIEPHMAVREMTVEDHRRAQPKPPMGPAAVRDGEGVPR